MKLFHLKLKLKRKSHDLARIPNKRKASVLIVLLLMVSAVYGLSLRSKAEENVVNTSGTKISADTTTTPVLYDGVSIHTKIENITGDIATNPLFNTATVKRGSGQRIRATLTINNPNLNNTFDVKFALPAGFINASITQYNSLTVASFNYDQASTPQNITFNSVKTSANQASIIVEATMP